ncbi:hypothetical protein D3C71_1610300 [compost metagenome]
MQLDGIRPRDGAKPVIAAPHPGHRLAVVKAQGQRHAHVHLARLALHDTHHVHALFVVAKRHEVVDAHHPAGRFMARFQHGGVGQIAARGGVARAVGRQPPAAVAVVAQQGGKAGGGIKMRQAQPVDRAVARHQRGRQHIADQAIVFDGFGHGLARPTKFGV